MLLNVEFPDIEIITESKYIIMITIINVGFNVDLKTCRQINYKWNRSLTSTKNVTHNLLYRYT